MTEAMVDHMRTEMGLQLHASIESDVFATEKQTGESWTALLGDCVEESRKLATNSVDFSLFSPPFNSLYTYSASDRDMGNCGSDAEFATHFKFLIEELYRITQPGRLVAFHCMNIPAMKERDGYIGIKDFRGQLTRAFMDQGFIFHSEHVIWKDPLTEAVRTKSKGLMHKQLMKDSSASRAGLPDYLIAMRKPGENAKPVPHENGLESFAGDDPPTEGTLSHERWRRYASPVWMDIRQGQTLQKKSARQEEDERHICPLQLDVIERALELWSTKGDLVFSPFMGIGSEGYQAIQMGRKFLGVELKRSYYDQACANLKAVQPAPVVSKWHAEWLARQAK